MAYENDDLKPVRPSKVLDAATDAWTNCTEEPQSCVSQKQVEAPNQTNCDDLTAQARTQSQATRAGDDDLRPSRPSEEVLNNRPETATQPCDLKQKMEEPSEDSSECPQVRNDIYEKYGLLKLVAYVCAAIVAIWLLGSFGSVLHSIAISESISELLVFVVIFVIEVSVLWYVVYFARRTFAKLPEVVQLHRKDWSDQELARQLKEDYIFQFPEIGQYAKFGGFGKNDEALQLLVRLRDHKYADSAGFMNEYDQFQSALDKRASGVIKRYAKLIGLKTAASPWKAVDVIAVFFNSSLMVCDIASIYNRKVSRQMAFRLVVRWFINLYISGELGQVAEGAADAIAKGTTDWLGQEGLSAILQPAVPLLAKFGGKIAEGGINAYLAYRLGRRASEYFKELVD